VPLIPAASAISGPLAVPSDLERVSSDGLKEDRAEDWPVKSCSSRVYPTAGEGASCMRPVRRSRSRAGHLLRASCGEPRRVCREATVGPDHERNAAAILVADDSTITTWQLAVTPGQDRATLGDPDSYFGSGADVGTRCFGCPSAQAAAMAVLGAGGGTRFAPPEQPPPPKGQLTARLTRTEPRPRRSLRRWRPESKA
jgi:hypothetical protein